MRQEPLSRFAWGHVRFIAALLTVLACSAPCFGQGLEWVLPYGGPTVKPNASAVDSDGNAYFVGSTDVTLPDQESAGNTDAFVRKSDPKGNALWTRRFGTAGFDEAYGVATDSTGVYVAGYTTGSFPGFLRMGTDAFLRKYDIDGNVQWTHQFGTTFSDYAVGVSIDSSGIYVAGRTYGRFDDCNCAKPGYWDAFVRKYDIDGNVQWTRQFGSPSNDQAEGVSAGPAGVLVVGWTTGPSPFPDQSSYGRNDAFISMYDSYGSQQWTRQFALGNYDESANGVSQDLTGIYVVGTDQTGTQTYAAFLRKYDFYGDVIWTRQFTLGIYPNTYAYAVSANSSGIYVAGQYKVNLADYDAFVRKYDADGNELWTLEFGTDEHDKAAGVDVAAELGIVYVPVQTTGDLAFDPLPVPVDNLPPAVGSDSASVHVNEGSIATNSGTYSDPDSGDNVTLTASVGTITKSGTGSGVWTWSLATADGPAQSQITITATDLQGAAATTSFVLNVDNVAPSVSSLLLDPAETNENGTVSLTVAFVDPGVDDSHTVSIDWGDGGTDSDLIRVRSAKTLTISHQYLDDHPSGTASDDYNIQVRITDKDGGAASARPVVTVNNVAPAITALAGPLMALPIGTAATISATFADVGTADTHICNLTWDDGQPDTSLPASFGSCSAEHAYDTAGVYAVSVEIRDDDGGIALQQFEYVVVYDPTAGFVTGGGWIHSMPGAYPADPTLTGKASFGFVSKYHKGAQVPTGETEFQFRVADLDFHSDTYEWLVVSGARAQYKGSGKINGSGDYGFLLTAVDGQRNGGGGVDKFRIKIWERETATIIYDNQAGAPDTIEPATALAAGSIVIHTP